MTTVTIDEAEAQWRALIARVRAGESFVITDGGVPVARIEPRHPPMPATAQDNAPAAVAAPPKHQESDEEWLDRLERAGIIKRGRGTAGRVLPPLPPLPPGDSGAGVLQALLDERREGR